CRWWKQAFASTGNGRGNRRANRFWWRWRVFWRPIPQLSGPSCRRRKLLCASIAVTASTKRKRETSAGSSGKLRRGDGMVVIEALDDGPDPADFFRWPLKVPGSIRWHELFADRPRSKRITS